MNLSFPILVSLLLHLAQAGWQANPQTVRDTAAKQAGFNYEEVRVPAYTLPDLPPGGGATIRTPDDWRKRRAEILDLFRGLPTRFPTGSPASTSRSAAASTPFRLTSTCCSP